VQDVLDLKTGASPPPSKPRKLEAIDFERMRIPREHWRASMSEVLESYRAPLERYMGEPPCERLDRRARDGEGLLLYGEAGTGKTSIAAIVARRMRAWRHSVFFTTAVDLRAGRRHGHVFDADDGTSIWDRARTVDVLVLDDITEADLADRYYGEAALLAMLRERAASRRVNIVTTRLDVMHGFVQSLLSTVARLAPFGVEGENRTYGGNRDLYRDLFPSPEGDE